MCNRRCPAQVIAVDIDAAGATPPPPGLLPEHMQFCVSWSQTKGFDALNGSAAAALWAPLVAHTIVGQPRASDLMLEGVLCQVQPPRNRHETAMCNRLMLGGVLCQSRHVQPPCNRHV